MSKKCLKCLIQKLIHPPLLYVILCKPPTRWRLLWLSLTQVWGRKTLQGKKSFQKTMDGVRKREMASPFKLLAMEWMIILKDQCKKGKSPSSRVVDFILFFIRQACDDKKTLSRRQPMTCIHLFMLFSHYFLSFVKSNYLIVLLSWSFNHDWYLAFEG